MKGWISFLKVVYITTFLNSAAGKIYAKNAPNSLLNFRYTYYKNMSACTKLFLSCTKWLLSCTKCFSVCTKWFLSCTNCFSVGTKWFLSCTNCFSVCTKWFLSCTNYFSVCTKWFLSYIKLFCQMNKEHFYFQTIYLCSVASVVAVDYYRIRGLAGGGFSRQPKTN